MRSYALFCIALAARALLMLPTCALTCAFQNPQSQQGASSSRSSPSMEYLHRATFAQALMDRTWLKEKEAKELFEQITGTVNDQEFMNMFGAVDKELSTFNFKLARLLFPLDDEWYIAVVNKASDEVAKTLGSAHNAAQIAFLKTVLEGIALDQDAQSGVATIGSVDANNLAFSQTQAATQASQAPAARLTMTQKEKLLPEFAEEGWLAHVPGQHGKYSMGVRSFLELKDFLLSLELPPDTWRAWERFL